MSLFVVGSTEFMQDLHRKIDPQSSRTPSGGLTIRLSGNLSAHKSIKCHDDVLAILLRDGTLHTFGTDTTLLGHDHNTSKVSSMDTISLSDFEVGGTHAFAVDDQKRVYGWGSNDRCQLGFTSTADLSTITKPKLQRDLKFSNNAHVVSIACGFSHSIFLLSDGSVWSCGSNDYGQLGTGTNQSSDGLRQITSLSGIPFVQIVSGYHHSFALTTSGTVFGWGRNDQGQLGVGDTQNKRAPTRLASLKSQKVKFVAAGKRHSAVLLADGGVFTFGSNELGQLGHGPGQVKSINPRKVFELMGTSVTQISCGKNHTTAYVANPPMLYTFGDNSMLQLGRDAIHNNANFTPALAHGPWSVDRGGSTRAVVSEIISGGDCSLMSMSDGGTSLDFRTLSTSPKISHLNDKLVANLSAADDVLNVGIVRDIDTLRLVMSSQSCLNSCFLASDHDKTSISYSGLSMMQARLKFSKLCNSKCQKVISTMTDSLQDLLIPSLSDNPPDIEALRLYLFLPECPLLQKPENFLRLTYPFASKLLKLSRNPGKVMDKWYRLLEPMYFLKTVEVFKNVLRETIKKPTLINHPSQLNTPLDMLKKLYEANQDQIIPFQKFYIEGISNVVDIQHDYMHYFKESKNVPTFCSYPFLLDSTVKTEILKLDAALQMRAAYNEANTRNIASIFGLSGINSIEAPRLELEVSRDSIVTNTLNQLVQVDTASLKKPLLVKFQGEEGEDAGGVRKEFFLLILREILDPKYGMFRSYEESGLMWFSDCQFESENMYYLVGLICGLAIYNNTIIDICFPLALYRKLLGAKVSMTDLKELDPTMHRSLQCLLDYEETSDASLADVFMLTFSIDRDNFGEAVTIDLIPDGRNKEVNVSNRGEYVQAYIDYIFNKSVRDQFNAFSKGFHKVCGGHVLNLFRPTELMEMVIGNQDYNWEDFERTAEYKGVYYRQHSVIDWFWNVFHALSLDDKKSFLLFLTGSNKIPINGVKIIIQSVSLGDSHLPVAHTCFNLLDLPIYSCEDKLREKLTKALLYNQGFHLV